MKADQKIWTALGLTALLAVGAGVYGARPDRSNESRKSRQVPEISRSEAEVALPKGHQKPHARMLPSPNGAAPEASEGYELGDEEVADLLADLPTREAALAERRAPSEVVLELAARGVDALLQPESCASGFDLETTARRGAGALGCSRADNGRKIYDGRVALRHDMPTPPGVPRMPSTYEVGTFSEGKRNGEFKVFDASGRNTSIRVYKDDALSGPVDDFSVDGTHLSRISYLDGYLHGPSIRYSGDEAIIELWGYGTQLDPETGARRPGAQRLEVAEKSR